MVKNRSTKKQIDQLVYGSTSFGNAQNKSLTTSQDNKFMKQSYQQNSLFKLEPQIKATIKNLPQPKDKKSRYEIRDKQGQKISLKKLKVLMKESLLTHAMSRKDIINRELLSPAHIKRCILKNKLHEISYRGTVYFDRKEISECIKYVNRVYSSSTFETVQQLVCCKYTVTGK